MKKFKFLKFIIYFIVSFMFFLTFSLSAQAAAVPIEMPILPYVPPKDAQIMDLISNAYGVTAPDIEDAEKKMEAYLKIYQGVLGQSYNSFKEKLDTIIDNAKTSGKITIDNEASTIIQQALNQALTSGYDEDTGIQGINNVSDAFNWIVSRYPNTITYSNFQLGDLQNDLVVNGGNVNQDCNIFIVIESSYLNIFVTPTSTNLYRDGNTIRGNVSRIRVRTVSITSRDYNNGNNINIPFTWNNMVDFVNLANLGITKKNVSAQDTSIRNALATQDVIPVTADTVTSDMTGDIVINIPAIIIYPAETVNDLPTTQEQLGVMPTTPDATAEQLEQIISELKDLKTASLGDIPTYSIDLTEYFPFCIPFDIGNILTILIAEPEAPSFDWEFPSGYQNGEVQYTTVTIDLSVWDPVAAVLRAGLVLVFIIGLGMVTRAVFLRG